MSNSQGPKVPIVVRVSQGDSWTDVGNTMLRSFQSLIQPNVISTTLSTPPGSPTNGDTYIVGSSATGAWTGKDKNLAYWTTDNPNSPGGLWEFFAPKTGWLVVNQFDKNPYIFDGTSWNVFTGGGGGGSFPDSVTVPAKVNLTAGQIIALFQDTDTIIKARPADATQDFAVTGFVTSNVLAGAAATVKLEGVFTVVTTNVDPTEVGGALYLDTSTPGAIAAGAGGPGVLYTRVGVLVGYDNGTNTATVLFNAGSISNFDLSALQVLTRPSVDNPSGIAGLDSNTRIREIELNKNYTNSTDLTSSGSTLSVSVDGSDVYAFTGTPATDVAVSFGITGGQSAGIFLIQNDTDHFIFAQAGGGLGAIFNIPPQTSQHFYYPIGVGLVAATNLKDGRRYFSAVGTNLDLTAAGILGEQHVVVSGSAGSSDITIDLPVAASVPGAIFHFHKVDSGAGRVLLQPGVNDFIGPGMSNGQIFTKLASQFDTLIITSDGSDWEIMSGVPFTAPTHQFLKSYNPGGTITAAQPSASDLSNGVIGTGAVVLASANGTFSLFMGGIQIPITGVKFPNASSIALTAGDHDLYTCPAGKRALVVDVVYTVPAGNPTSVTGLVEVKIGGTYHVFDFFAIGAVAGTYGGTNSVAPFLLAAGEIFAINTDHSGMSAWPFIVEFDDTANIADIRLLSLTSGANTLFTMPASKTIAFMGFPSAFTLPGAGRIWYYNGTLANRTIQLNVVPNGGSPGTANAIFNAVCTQGQMVQAPLYGALATGDFVSINTDSSASGQIAWIIFTEL
jgi:predicted RecA/RadA family phage recombinase